MYCGNCLRAFRSNLNFACSARFAPPEALSQTKTSSGSNHNTSSTAQWRKAPTVGSSRIGGRASTSVVGGRSGVCFGFREGLRTFGAANGTVETFAFAIIITALKMDYKNCHS